MKEDSRLRTAVFYVAIVALTVATTVAVVAILMMAVANSPVYLIGALVIGAGHHELANQLGRWYWSPPPVGDAQSLLRQYQEITGRLSTR